MVSRRTFIGLLLCALFLFPATSAWAANKYWVGGTGNLDGVDTTHISDSDGGAGGAVYPSASDTLNFTALSGGGTVTFTAGATFTAIVCGAHTGTINTNGQTVTLSSSFNGTGTGTRTLTLGASVVNVGGSWQFATTTNLTFNADTSTINVTGAGNFQGGGLTYATVVFTGGGENVSDVNTFGTLTYTGTAAKTNYFLLSANQTITGTLTINGNSATNRVIVSSSTKGTQRTLTAATVSASNVDFQDIVLSPSVDLSAITGGSGDAGGNSGITFTTPQTNYWVGGTGSRSDVTHWASSSGGAGSSGRVPLIQDTARIDASSGTGTITQDMPRIGATDFTGSSGITWTTSTAASFFGSINLTGLSTLTASSQGYTYEGRGSATLTSAGKTWAKSFSIDCVTGNSLTLGDALTFSTGVGIAMRSGTFDSNGYAVTMDFINAALGTATVTMGASTWTLFGNSNIWQGGASTTINAGTSTIRVTSALTAARQFQGAGKTFYRLENATTGAFALQFTGSNTFQDGIYVDASAAARTVQFTGSTNTTVGRLGRLDSTTNVITLSPVSGTFTLTKSGGGVVNLDYLTVSGSTGSPASTWYAGSHSTDGGSNSGWTFGPAPNRAFITDLLPEMKRAGASAPAHDQR